MFLFFPFFKVELLSEESKPDFIGYPSGIFINEILPSPTGPDEKEEWIEIFNQNSFEVDLSGWRISDTEGTIKTYTFPKGTIISGKSFLVISRPTSKIVLNNEGDGLNLSQPNGKIIDSVSYEKAPRGQSYNRENSKWFWSTILTPGSKNIIPIQKTEEVESPEELEKIDINTTPLESIEPEKGLAEVVKPLKEEPLVKEIPKSLSLFLIALTIAVFSGIIVLILKIKLKKVYNKNI